MHTFILKDICNWTDFYFLSIFEENKNVKVLIKLPNYQDKVDKIGIKYQFNKANTGVKLWKLIFEFISSQMARRQDYQKKANRSGTLILVQNVKLELQGPTGPSILVPAEGLLASLTSCPASLIQQRGLRPQSSTPICVHWSQFFSPPIFEEFKQSQNYLTNFLAILGNCLDFLLPPNFPQRIFFGGVTSLFLFP